MATRRACAIVFPDSPRCVLVVASLTSTMPMTADYDFVSKEWLLDELRRDSNAKRLVILDCRSSNEYSELHIRDAVNFSIPSIMLRRLAAGKIELASTIKCRELKAKICSTYKENTFVLYNDCCTVQQHLADSIVSVLLRRLSQDGCHVVCLEDGFSRFRATFPEWCDTSLEVESGGGGGGDQQPGGIVVEPLPLMGLRSLRISACSLSRGGLSSTANSSTESSDTDDRCDSSLGMEDDKEFPVQILPHLYLGNAANSEDSQALARHNIEYVLNVTPDLPNVFQDVGNIKYMQIPIADDWSNLASYFPKAFSFIDEARNNQKGVLVHCLAGISRSVTITVAYLMYKCSLNLNDAFNVVRACKSNIAPNFHFLRQLHNFEKELKLDVSSQSPAPLMEQIEAMRAEQALLKRMVPPGGGGGRPGARRKCPNCGLRDACCKCGQHSDFLSPLAQIGVSPDSGIEFDRWASSSTTPAE